MADFKKDGFGGGGRGGGGGGRGGDRDERGGRGGDRDERGGRGFGRRKVCRYCADRNAKIDYKNPGAKYAHFVTERGKIVPRRISGNCAKHQREVAVAIKRSRNVALLPYTVMQSS